MTYNTQTHRAIKKWIALSLQEILVRGVHYPQQRGVVQLIREDKAPEGILSVECTRTTDNETQVRVVTQNSGTHYLTVKITGEA